jgi:hypothetical protein
MLHFHAAEFSLSANLLSVKIITQLARFNLYPDKCVCTGNVIFLVCWIHLNEDVGTGNDLDGIVPDEERLNIHGLAIFHVTWAPNLDLGW